MAFVAHVPCSNFLATRCCSAQCRRARRCVSRAVCRCRLRCVRWTAAPPRNCCTRLRQVAGYLRFLICARICAWRIAGRRWAIVVVRCTTARFVCRRCRAVCARCAVLAHCTCLRVPSTLTCVSQTAKRRRWCPQAALYRRIATFARTASPAGVFHRCVAIECTLVFCFFWFLCV